MRLFVDSKGDLQARAMLQECNRVLRPGGEFYLITYGDPETRLRHLDNSKAFDWKVYFNVVPREAPSRKMHPVPKIYIYHMKRPSRRSLSLSEVY